MTIVDHTTRVERFSPSQAVQRVDKSSLRAPQPSSNSEIISLAMGEPGFDTPANIRETAHAALEAGFTHYAHPQGDPDLRAAISTKLNHTSNEQFDTDHVLITHGGTGGLAAAILGLVDPGDIVVIPDPTYSLYADLVNLAGGRVVRVPVNADLHWDLERLAAALVGAKLFVFCNPCNPTGIVHTRNELAALGHLLDGSGTLVVSDEAYSDLVYTSEPFVSALFVPDLATRTLYCQTFSKAYAMTGWRIGYLAGPAPLIAAATRVHSTMAGAVSSVTQRAALTAINCGEEDVAAMRAAYRDRRDLMVSGLSTIHGLHLIEPHGAFYAFPEYDHPLMATDMVQHLHRHGIAVRPGSEFGPGGEHHLRLSFAAEPTAITAGIDRLRAGLEHLETTTEQPRNANRRAPAPSMHHV